MTTLVFEPQLKQSISHCNGTHYSVRVLKGLIDTFKGLDKETLRKDLNEVLRRLLKEF